MTLVGLSGCSGPFASSRGATDVIVHNDGDVSRTVELTVTQRDSEAAPIDTRLELSPNEQTIINNNVIMDADYDVSVSFTDPTRDSPYSETQAWNDAGQPLHIMLNNQIVFAVQIG
jgi:hypothetical protein